MSSSVKAPQEAANTAKLTLSISSASNQAGSKWSNQLTATFVPDTRRVLQFHGEQGARISRLDSAFHASSRPRTLIFTLLSPLLFFMPNIYLKELERLYVDQTIHYDFWAQFMTSLKSDWDGSIIPVR